MCSTASKNYVVPRTDCRHKKPNGDAETCCHRELILREEDKFLSLTRLDFPENMCGDCTQRSYKLPHFGVWRLLGLYAAVVFVGIPVVEKVFNWLGSVAGKVSSGVMDGFSQAIEKKLNEKKE